MLLEQGRSFKFPSSLIKPLTLFVSYAVWVLLLRLLFLSFLVYFLTRQGHRATFEEINEAFAANEIPFMGLASAGFILVLKGFSPLIDRAGELKFTAKQFRTNYLPGFLRGLVLGASIVVAFWLLGTFRFIGFFVQIEDAPVAAVGIVLRIAALLALGLCDELVFRAGRNWSSTLPRIGILAAGYCVVKMAQFELSWMHIATLLLLSACLSMRRLTQDSFLNGAGFWSALLIVFHPLCSLPIFGSDFSGVFLLKYQAQATLPAWISGGIGGPLSSVALQAILLIDLVRAFFAYRASEKAAQRDAGKKALFKLSTSQ